MRVPVLLLMLCLVAAIPLGGVVVATRLAATGDATLELDQDLARGAALAQLVVDQELAARLGLLSALAASEELASDPIDLDRFRHDAVRFLAVQSGWASIGIGPLDPSLPTVGGIDPSRSDATVAMQVPLEPVAGRGVALLGRVQLSAFEHLLQRLTLSDQHVGLVVDAAGRVLARTDGAVGASERGLAPDVLVLLGQALEASVPLTLASGAAGRMVTRRSAGGWWIVVAAPIPAAGAVLPLRALLVGAGLAGLLAVVGAAAAGWSQRRRRAAEVASLDALAAAGDARLEAVASNFPGVIFRRLGDGRYSFVSDGVRSFGLTPERVSDRRVLALLHRDDRRAWLAAARAALAKGSGFEADGRLSDRAGSERWVRVAAAQSTLPGGMMVWDGVLVDATSAKAAERDLRAALAAKQVLLLEVHHRVKNNLQLISNLLRLQQSEFADPSLRAAFRECLNRVMAMGLIHDLLYDLDGPVGLDFGAYLQALASKLGTIHGSDERVAIQIQAAPVSLALDRAVPLALLVNELLSNALKHAFPFGRSGTILVKLDRVGPVITLSVRDDGVGLPDPPVERKRGDGLGLKIVQSLCAQLNADMVQRSDGGTVFAITFATARG
jgi:PAS domain S-box-containing protein